MLYRIMYESEHGFNIRRYVPKKLISELQLQKYSVALVAPKNISTAIKLLKDYEHKQQELNNNSLCSQFKSFLKRVNKQQIPNEEAQHVQVLLCPLENQATINELLELLQGLIIRTVVREIPKLAPTTKQNFKQWMKIWPINFIEPELSKEVVHEAEEAQFIFSLMISPAKFPAGLYLFKGSRILAQEQGECAEKTIDHPVLRLLQRWSASTGSTQTEYYYLTGLKMFIRNSSLCGMCAMALVHSRLCSAYFSEQPSSEMEDVMSCPRLNHQINLFVVSADKVCN